MAVDLSFFRSETSQRLRAEGRVEGRAEGRAEGGVEGRAQDVLLLLDHRGVPLSGEARARISTCRDADLVRAWFIRAVTATSEGEVFTEG